MRAHFCHLIISAVSSVTRFANPVDNPITLIFIAISIPLIKNICKTMLYSLYSNLNFCSETFYTSPKIVNLNVAGTLGTKGQIKPQADLRAVDSLKKRTNKFGFFCRKE